MRCSLCSCSINDDEEYSAGGQQHGEVEVCVKRLLDRQDEHLLLIRRLTTDSIPPNEAADLRSQIGNLIAEIGTLRSELKAIRDV